MNLTTEMKSTDAEIIDLQSQLIGFCLNKLHRKNLAEDVSQEAIARYFATIQKGVVIENRRAWVFSVARNLIVDHCRANKAITVGHDWGDCEVDPNSLDSNDEQIYQLAGSEVAQEELVTVIPRALKKLPVKDQQYLNNYYFARKSYESLANDDGISVTASKGRMFRARQRLRSQLELEMKKKCC
ncbi:MAG: sigma-70 family RNA polymerase sigma factor [Planctomycetota bacterium]|jgi:RNA polymerase sigma-70 factor (ECF subfamily)|nr:sigma-70 family RNA polymerase sigma factor [Planctomycetota bacterium]